MRRFALWASLAGAVCGTVRAQNHGAYLPSTLTFGAGITDVAWTTPGDNLPSFGFDVTQNASPIGVISLSYDTWTGNYTGLGAVVGAGIAGGFYLNKGIGVIPGFQLCWVQVITPATTVAGNNVWNAPDGSGFPDTANTDSPAYPSQSLPVIPASPLGSPTVSMQDFPYRFPLEGNQVWRAELGLVALNPATDQARVVDTFLWGFDVTQTTAGVTASTPSLWGPATTAFDSTLAAAFSGRPFNGVIGAPWTSKDDLAAFPVFVTPEPGTSTCLLWGCGCLCLGRRLLYCANVRVENTRG